MRVPGAVVSRLRAELAALLDPQGVLYAQLPPLRRSVAKPPEPELPYGSRGAVQRRGDTVATVDPGSLGTAASARRASMADQEDGGSITGYTNDELALLHSIAEGHGVSGDHIVSMIREEMSYHDMGRRRGLFPSLQQIIADMAENR